MKSGAARRTPKLQEVADGGDQLARAIEVHHVARADDFQEAMIAEAPKRESAPAMPGGGGMGGMGGMDF